MDINILTKTFNFLDILLIAGFEGIRTPMARFAVRTRASLQTLEYS